MNEPKPALILDDDSFWSATIGQCLRVIAGLPVIHFPTLETFEASFSGKRTLAEELKRYSIVNCDNSFSGAGGRKLGEDFLTKEAGPAVLELPPEERPLLICFAPSTIGLVLRLEKDLWEEYGIVCFHKLTEAAALGLAARLAVEHGTKLNREAIVGKILGLDLADGAVRGPKDTVLFDVRFGLGIGLPFPGESFDQVEGPARPADYQTVLETFANELGMGEKELEARISFQVEQAKRSLEGSKRRGVERAS